MTQAPDITVFQRAIAEWKGTPAHAGFTRATEAEYNDALCSLPPKVHNHIGFLMGEAYTTDSYGNPVYFGFLHQKGYRADPTVDDYICGLMTVEQFYSFS